MTTANSNTYTRMIDIVRQQAPDGSLFPIIEQLSKLTPFMQDAAWLPANNGTYHRINRREALPAPVRRRINQGVAITKSDTQQVDEVTTMLADKSAIDSTLVRMNGAEYRAREVAAHLMGLEQKVEQDLLMGSLGGNPWTNITSDPDGIDGIMTRLNSTTGVPGGNQIKKVDGAGTNGQNASVLLVGWGPMTVHGVYPKGLPAGVYHRDFGEVSNGGVDANSNYFPAFVDYFEWHHGLAVEDWRYVARGANVDCSAISVSGNNLLTAMITLFHRCLTADASARWAYYLPRFLAEELHQQARTGVTQSTLKITEVGGQRITEFLGIPVRTADTMTITESTVS